MQAFTPKKPTSDSGHPGDEELAAYVDGMLEGEEKARVAEHLVSCADCFRVYSETLRFQVEEEEEEEQDEEKAVAAAAGTVVPFPSDRKVRPPWWLAAAAAALVVGVGAGLFTLFGPAPEMTTARLVEPLPPAVGELWMDSTDRGGADEEVPEIEEDLSEDIKRSFQIGVQLVNLQVSLERNDRAVEGQVLPKLIELLQQDLVASLVPEYEEYYTGLRVAIFEGAAPRTFLQESSEKSEELRELFDDPYLELGRFVEAGRLAAIAREPSFFQRWKTRRMLRDLLKQEEGELKFDTATVRTLEAISTRLEKGELQAAAYAALRKDFEKILLKYYPPR
jgi:hypothetical protein